MGKYIIPFFYTFYTRTKGLGKKVAYLFTFIIPVLLYGLTSAYENEFSFIKVGIAIIIGLIGTMSIYEIGYIRNDVFTIKKEKKPTLRLERKELDYVEKNVRIILGAKYLISLISIGIIFLLGFDYIQYIIALILIEIFYYIHNNIRGKKSILSFFVLSTLRYITPLTVIHTNIWITVSVFILMVTVSRTFEKAAEKKFKISILEFVGTSIDVNILRGFYYLIVLLVILAQYMMFKIPMVFVTLSIYYFIYRGLIACGYIVKQFKKH
ncbi:hypothetical protein [uncultured Clostridium sp.]|uniref:hypothetical protein n=1 Tax=uncultured Clostridium sp. TaxID=59620 RepID=UPI00262D8F90|nr:hypothetical protein [uncultured Clostridium sp.]